jgi:D-cysteine desulfhydrase
MEPAPRLARALGLRPEGLWIKRDDLTGLAGGGNKIRKLEWTVAAALAEGADTLVTTGAPQSNHARLTAAAGARLGLEVHLVLAGQPPAVPAGNLLLDALLGASVHWAGDADLATVAADLADALLWEGHKPYLIPFGGSSALSIRGYRTAGLEILAQQPEALTVVTAVGSGGTMAGLVTALGPHRVLGVSTGAVTDARAAVARLLRDGGWPVNELRVDDSQIGAGYGTLTDATRDAIELTARTEGIILDPIYTGRAMAALIAAARGGAIPPVGVVFVHTGGLPGLFGHGWRPGPPKSPE